MNAAQKVKGHPVLGGPNDRLLAPSIIPQIRRVIVVEALLAEAWDGRIEVMAVELPTSLRLPTAVIIDIGGTSDVFQWESVEFVARELLRHAAASVLGCRPQDVDPDDLDVEQLRTAWSLIQRSVIQFEGECPRAVEAVASAFEAALADLADEHGIGG
ncbi:MAG: hypothetical protein K6T28_10175 [Acidothermus sp.]|nr:hypothetical protein [Acidothermus sp.]